MRHRIDGRVQLHKETRWQCLWLGWIIPNIQDGRLSDIPLPKRPYLYPGHPDIGSKKPGRPQPGIQPSGVELIWRTGNFT